MYCLTLRWGQQPPSALRSGAGIPSRVVSAAAHIGRLWLSFGPFMLQPDRELCGYYAARAAEYERIYDKSERQADLARLRHLIPSYFVGRSVLEIACGTGYWTQFIAPAARKVTAIV